MKISKKNEMKVTMGIMVFVMTSIITFASVTLNFGFTEEFISRWVKSWGFSFILGVPIVLVIVPIIKKQIAKYVQD